MNGFINNKLEEQKSKLFITEAQSFKMKQKII